MFPTFHLYPPTAPHVAYMQPKANAPSFFMADELRQVLLSCSFLFVFCCLFKHSHSPLLYREYLILFLNVLPQELINRHLITMAQIDHAENPGCTKCTILPVCVQQNKTAMLQMCLYLKGVTFVGFVSHFCYMHLFVLIWLHLLN